MKDTIVWPRLGFPVGTGRPLVDSINIREWQMIGFRLLLGFRSQPLSRLIFLNEGVIIAGWLAIKTAGKWKTYEGSRTAFNRFLVGNLMVLWVSYLWLV